MVQHHHSGKWTLLWRQWQSRLVCILVSSRLDYLRLVKAHHNIGLFYCSIRRYIFSYMINIVHD